MQICMTQNSVELTLFLKIIVRLAPTHHMTMLCPGAVYGCCNISVNEGSYILCSHLHLTTFPPKVPSRTCFFQYLNQSAFSKEIELTGYISIPTGRYFLNPVNYFSFFFSLLLSVFMHLPMYNLPLIIWNRIASTVFCEIQKSMRKVGFIRKPGYLCC